MHSRNFGSCLLLITSLLCCSTQTIQASGRFNFNPTCQQAYNYILSLKIDSAIALLDAEKLADPNNLIPLYLEDYIDFFRLFTSDEKHLYNQLKRNRDDRLNQLKQGDRGSPYFAYTQAEIYLHWAVMKIKFGDYLPAVFEVRRAFRMLKTNIEKHPDFIANDKSFGLLLTLLGAIPDKFKWGLNILGMEGDVARGMSRLDRAAQICEADSSCPFLKETITLKAFLLLHMENNAEAAWQVLMSRGFPEKGNLMDYYSIAHIGVHGNHSRDATKILRSKPSGDAWLSFPQTDYLLGLGKLYLLEDDANAWFLKFLDEYNGDSYRLSVLQKLGWYHLMQSDTGRFLNYMEQVREGEEPIIDADKMARKEAERKGIPHVGLLKSRLLYDGGQHREAYDLLVSVEVQSEHDQVEKQYRLARILHAQQKNEAAIEAYKMTIEMGQDLPNYFAANSALQLGLIYERLKQINESRKYYNRCLDFKQHEYKNSLDQKAKAGLSRID